MIVTSDPKGPPVFYGNLRRETTIVGPPYPNAFAFWQRTVKGNFEIPHCGPGTYEAFVDGCSVGSFEAGTGSCRLG